MGMQPSERKVVLPRLSEGSIFGREQISFASDCRNGNGALGLGITPPSFFRSALPNSISAKILNSHIPRAGRIEHELINPKSKYQRGSGIQANTRLRLIVRRADDRIGFAELVPNFIHSTIEEQNPRHAVEFGNALVTEFSTNAPEAVQTNAMLNAP